MILNHSLRRFELDIQTSSLSMKINDRVYSVLYGRDYSGFSSGYFSPSGVCLCPKGGFSSWDLPNTGLLETYIPRHYFATFDSSTIDRLIYIFRVLSVSWIWYLASLQEGRFWQVLASYNATRCLRSSLWQTQPGQNINEKKSIFTLLVYHWKWNDYYFWGCRNCFGMKSACITECGSGCQGRLIWPHLSTLIFMVFKPELIIMFTSISC